MSAKKGWMQSARLLGCLMVVAMVGSAVLASVASASKPAPAPTAYVALGDSLSFGYKAKTFNQNQVANKEHCEAGVTAAEKGETALASAEKALCEPASSFEPGFVGLFGKKLASAEKKAGNALTTVNLGCPGETSDGLIGHLLGNESAEADPCAYHNLLPSEGFPLKTEIGSASELEAAANLIATKSAGAVTAVSLQIGNNDELHVVAKCETPSYDAEHGFGSLTECIVHEAGPEGFAYPGGLFHHILVNIGTTIGVLRGESVKYTGRVLVIGFYNPDATVLPGSDALDKILNENLEKTIEKGEYGPGVVLAQPFPLINPEAAAEPKEEKEVNKDLKKEESAICKYTEMCNGGKIPSPSGDIHPTEKGYKKIAKLMDEAWGL
jgi:lysophospholipase L1-like esterase